MTYRRRSAAVLVVTLLAVAATVAQGAPPGLKAAAAAPGFDQGDRLPRAPALLAEYNGQRHNFYTILSYSYLQYDLVSAGGKGPTAERAKDVVAEVLAKRVERGLLSEALARENGTAIFRTNALAFFKLPPRIAKSPNPPIPQSPNPPIPKISK